MIATATARKAASLVRSLGADVAIDARSDDAVDALAHRRIEHDHALGRVVLGVRHGEN